MPNLAEIYHSNINYIVIPIEGCLELAKALQVKMYKWHFHILSPGCIHNPEPTKYATVIEDDTNDVAYIAFSEKISEQGRELVRMLHGDGILETVAVTQTIKDEIEASSLLSRVINLNKQAVNWHHHMHFPNCSFNPHHGKWCISVEHGQDGLFFETYDKEPKSVLREVEKLYFSRFEKFATL